MIPRPWWIDADDEEPAHEPLAAPPPSPRPDQMTILLADRAQLMRRRLMQKGTSRKATEQQLVRVTAEIMRLELRTQSR